MAFGYTRQPGTRRRFLNTETGEEISYRQYNKVLDRLGERQPALKSSVEALRAAERELERIRQSLSAREAQLEARETLLAERERELALERQLFRAGRQNAGQRRYNAALEAYVRAQRSRGRRLNKTEARKEAAFKQAVRDLKGRANPRRNPNIADANRFARQKAMASLGGDVFFRDQYESLYGGRAGGHGMRVVRMSARGRSDSGRRAA